MQSTHIWEIKIEAYKASNPALLKDGGCHDDFVLARSFLSNLRGWSHEQELPYDLMSSDEGLYAICDGHESEWV